MIYTDLSLQKQKSVDLCVDQDPYQFDNYIGGSALERLSGGSKCIASSFLRSSGHVRIFYINDSKCVEDFSFPIALPAKL